MSLVQRITLEHFEDHEEALAAEAAAQVEEDPVHNIMIAGHRRAGARKRRSPEELREIRLARTHYLIDGGITCENCDWNGRWVPKGKRIDECECPRCAICSLRPKAAA